jgi:D-proline reductase (dithiol) PrdB
MNERDRLTPINRRRERGLQWSNDSVWGERVARWLGSVLGGLQFRLERIRPSSDIPWTPLRRPLAQATVAVVSTAGVHLCSETPFELKSDASFRIIPRTARATDLCITHEHYDRRDAAHDPNLVFPLQCLLELEAEGIVGRVADANYGFGFTEDPLDLLAPGREVGARLAQADVDLALLVPA